MIRFFGTGFAKVFSGGEYGTYPYGPGSPIDGCEVDGGFFFIAN